MHRLRQVPPARQVLVQREPHAHRPTGGTVAHGRHQRDEQCRPPLDAAAPRVVARVPQGGEELVHQAACAGVDVDQVHPRVGQPACGPTDLTHQQLDLGFGDRAARRPPGVRTAEADTGSTAPAGAILPDPDGELGSGGRSGVVQRAHQTCHARHETVLVDAQQTPGLLQRGAGQEGTGDHQTGTTARPRGQEGDLARAHPPVRSDSRVVIGGSTMRLRSCRAPSRCGDSNSSTPASGVEPAPLRGLRPLLTGHAAHRRGRWSRAGPQYRGGYPKTRRAGRGDRAQSVPKRSTSRSITASRAASTSPARGVGVVPRDDLPRALLEPGRGDEVRHEPAQLGGVEDPRVRLVPQQPRAPLRVHRGDRVGGHVHDARLDAGRRRQGLRDPVPGEHVVTRDTDRLTDRARVPQERHEAAREVPVVGQGPQRGPVAVHHDRPSLPHPLHSRPAAVQRDQRRAVGMGGPDDRHGRATIAVGGHQDVLAGDLVARVLPPGVAQRGGLGDREEHGRGLVRRGRADEDELPRAPLEHLQVGAHVVGGEGQPVDHGVVLLAGDRLPQRGRVADVEVTHPRALGPAGRPEAPRVNSVRSMPRSTARSATAELITPVPPRKSTRRATGSP